MDTVISNKYSSVLNELDIEVSKKLEGEYTVDEIISQFKKFFFNKMFLGYFYYNSILELCQAICVL